MNRARRILHRGWLRNALSALTFGYYPYIEDVVVDWCLSVPATLHDWTLTNANLHDWALTDSTLHDWTLASATVHDWTTTDATLHDWTMTVEVIACG